MSQPKRQVPDRESRPGRALAPDIIPAERRTTQPPLQVVLQGEGPTASEIVLEGR